MYCQSCHADITSDCKYCPECGLKVQSEPITENTSEHFTEEVTPSFDEPSESATVRDLPEIKKKERVFALPEIFFSVVNTVFVTMGAVFLVCGNIGNISAFYDYAASTVTENSSNAGVFVGILTLFTAVLFCIVFDIIVTYRSLAKPKLLPIATVCAEALLSAVFMLLRGGVAPIGNGFFAHGLYLGTVFFAGNDRAIGCLSNGVGLTPGAPFIASVFCFVASCSALIFRKHAKSRPLQAERIDTDAE